MVGVGTNPSSEKPDKNSKLIRNCYVNSAKKCNMTLALELGKAASWRHLPERSRMMPGLKKQVC